jgi:hypothetical protein
MTIRNVLAAIAISLCICAVLPAQGQGQCSLISLRGTWGFTEIGWSIPIGTAAPVPVTVIGLLSLDFTGKMTGSATVISGAPLPGTAIPAGEPLDVDAVEGTVELNSDCTGFWKYSLRLRGVPAPPFGPFVERIVYSPQKDLIYSMSVGSPTSHPMWIGTATRVTNSVGPIAWPAM